VTVNILAGEGKKNLAGLDFPRIVLQA